jgi:hypothetical protein
MRTLKVRREIFTSSSPGLDEISSRLDDHGPGELINTLNWDNFGYRPEVRFNIAWNDKEILLKYYVREEFVKAEKTASNQQVSEDSCVELFISPIEDGIYYNFEFNAIGTILLGAGTGREERSLAPIRTINKVRRTSSYGNKPFNEKRGESLWTITIAIPLDAFFFHDLNEIKGKTFRANFYKCGDGLTRPHYLSWSPVGTKKPDFHQPVFFGILEFI